MISLDNNVDKPSDKPFDRQALMQYMQIDSGDKELIVLVFEPEDLDELLSTYTLDVVCGAIDSILFIIDEILPSNAKIFRVSNDSFCIVFENAVIKRCMEFAHILVALITERKACSNVDDVDMTIRVGVARGRGDMVLTKAFSALKCAKKFLSTVYFLDANDDVFKEHQESRIRWNLLVKNAIRDGRIVPFYQPIYDNSTKKINKFECLSRLIDNDRIFFPFDFFDVARKMGFMRSITFSVINNSFNAFKDNDYQFSINITEEDIQDTQVIDYLSSRCEKYKINPSRITIELLEDIKFDDDLVVNNIFVLKEMGFKIAIDDFGYANSNFGRLVKLDIDYIKIDGQFVKNMDIDEVSYKIVKSIVAFANSIGVKCIAEYVHSESVQKMITDLGVEYSQGYYIGQATSDLTIRRSDGHKN